MTLYNEKVLMIILIKNESEVGYKITPRKVEMERRIELGLERIVGEGFGGGFLIFLFFEIFIFLIFFENFLIFLKLKSFLGPEIDVM